MSTYGFKFSKPLTAGKHTIRVMNIGTQEHEAVMVKLAPGKTMKDLDAWFESGMKGSSDQRRGKSGAAAHTRHPVGSSVDSRSRR
jgi:hypothetical protein